MAKNTSKAQAKSSTLGAPQLDMPKRTVASKARVTDPGFRKDKDVLISDLDSSYLNTSIQDLRAVEPIRAIKALARFNGVFSAAVHSYVQLGMSGFLVTGYRAGTTEFDPVATQVAQAVLNSTDTLYNYTEGYSDKPATNSLLETLLKEVMCTGGCGIELVLNKAILPDRIVPVSTTSLRWKSRTDGTSYPEQVSSSGADNISLNIPTFFFATTHQNAGSVQPRSPLEAALQMIFVFTEFLEDLSRVLRRSGHTRLVAKLNTESVRAMASQEVLLDAVKLKAHFDAVREQVVVLLNGLDPQDALVSYDVVNYDLMTANGDKSDYSSLLEVLGTMMASSLKSMASVLGLSQGSQNLATTEALVYLKMVRSAQVPVEVVMSRAITLATRLITGTDSYCKFEFDDINLRPAEELSAHRSVIFQNELNKLSLGLYTDDEFAHRVRAGQRAPGAPNLSGTMFMNHQSSATQPKDVASNNGAQPRNLNEGTKQGTPTSQPGGKAA
jgi:hypothetical protein